MTRSKPRLALVLAFAALLGLAATPAAHAQQATAAVPPDCEAGWQSPACLKAVSTSNMTMAANYGAALQQSNQNAQAENLKQHCAASTAAMQGTYPAYAMRSAFVECANAISDISQATGLQPDAGQYRVLVAATLCLSSDPRCTTFTQGGQ